MRRYLTCFTLILLLLGITLYSSAETQGWNNNSLSLGLSSKWSLKLTNELRANEFTLMDIFLKNFQGGLVYKFSGKWYASILYKRENVEKPDFTLGENGWGTLGCLGRGHAGFPPIGSVQSLGWRKLTQFTFVVSL